MMAKAGAASGKALFSQDHGHEGFIIVTAGSNQGMVDIHDRRPLVLQPESDFKWHKVDNAVRNIHNQGKVLTEPV